MSSVSTPQLDRRVVQTHDRMPHDHPRLYDSDGYGDTFVQDPLTFTPCMPSKTSRQRQKSADHYLDFATGRNALWKPFKARAGSDMLCTSRSLDTVVGMLQNPRLLLQTAITLHHLEIDARSDCRCERQEKGIQEAPKHATRV